MTGRLHLSPAEWPARSGNVPSLDGVRGCSILLVLIGHMLLPSSLVGISAIGLKVFFVLSGFLITRLLLAENKNSGGISLKNFYIRRVLRLYPVLIVYVGVTATTMMLRGQPVVPVEVASVFFYFVNYLIIHYDHMGYPLTLPVGILWSLSVEEHFYLFAPLALVLMRGEARKMLLLALAICVIALCLRLTYAYNEPGIVNTLELYQRSETRFDSIAFGAILACLPEFDWGRRLITFMTRRSVFFVSVAIMLATFALRDSYFQNTWRFTFQGLALMPILASVIFAKPVPLFNRVLNLPVMIWVGALSYSLYVWHGAVVFFFSAWLELLPHAIISWVEFAIAFVFAILSYYLLEKPIMGLRKRFGHRITPVEATPSRLQTSVQTSSAASPS
ncbi:acyltransferase family protein [Rhizobium wenxiniae]|uniref:acyltransferase family protein n=1 Tax=Rhizobium wenxiniae TaxID=1737357 RepID=UPI003C1B0C59